MLNFLVTFNTTTIISIVVWGLLIALAIIIEAETAEFVSIWFAVGALGGLITVLFGGQIYIQVIVFAVLSLILVFATRPLVARLTKNTEVKTNVDRLIGMKGLVTKTISEGEKGEVKVNYQLWTAISNQKIDEGKEVVIKEITGNKLVVEVVEEIEIK